MKLKNTVNGVELDLIGNDWTLIPTQAPEQWVDVTERLVHSPDLTFKSRFDDPGVWGCAVTTAGNSPYRLRKIRVFDEHGHNLLSRWAFIVERRVP